MFVNADTLCRKYRRAYSGLLRMMISTVKVALSKLRPGSPPGLRIAFVVITVGTAALLRWELRGFFGDNVLFITFYPAVAIVALIAGGRAGAAATALSALAADWLFVEPNSNLSINRVGDIIALALFCISGVVISAMAGMLGRARQREVEATEREKAARALRLSEELLNFHIENSPLAVIEREAVFRLSRWSGEAERIFGWRAEEVLGQALG